MACFQEDGTTEDMATWVRITMYDACDLVTRRIKCNRSRTSTHWWSQDLTELRTLCNRTKRRMIRLRSRRDHPELPQAEDEYRLAKRTFRNAIRDAKARSWQELIA